MTFQIKTNQYSSFASIYNHLHLLLTIYYSTFIECTLKKYGRKTSLLTRTTTQSTYLGLQQQVVSKVNLVKLSTLGLYNYSHLMTHTCTNQYILHRKNIITLSCIVINNISLLIIIISKYRNLHNLKKKQLY